MTTKTNLFVLGGLLAALCAGLGQPIIVLQPQSQFVVAGASVNLGVSAIGFEPLRYQWRRNEAALEGETNDTLVLTNVQSVHSGRYSVVVTDDDNQTTTSEAARLTVHSTFTRVTTGPIATDTAYSYSCAWGDYDGDGYLDLIVGNGLGDANALYHNEGNGTFTRVTTGPIAASAGDSGGCSWGDYDNDGDIDLFVANWQLPSFLFRNEGNGSFTRIINGTMGTNVAYSNGAAWGDYDDDGFLDLVVANAFGNEYLYRNSEHGTFSQILTGAVVTSGLHSAFPCWSDYDNDGKLDLAVSSAGGTSDSRSLLFHNEGGGVFTRVTPAFWTEIAEGGSDWGDFDNDGDLDLAGYRWGDGTQNSVVIFRNEGGGTLSRITVSTFDRVEAIPRNSLWGDYDNDGWLDLYCATMRPGTAQKHLLFHNNGDGTFTRVTEGEIVNTAVLLQQPCGAGWADYDNDGFLDLFVAIGAEGAREPNFLYHNDGNGNRWLSVNCVGAAANRSSLGARVHVKTVIGGVPRSLLREVSSGSGFGGSALRIHFGLGDATNVDLVRIEWPSGTVKEWRNVAVNQILRLKEPPVLADAGFNGPGEFRLNLKGGRGLPYLVEYSTNLVHWIELTRFTATNITTPIIDRGTSSALGRFYRALEQD